LLSAQLLAQLTPPFARWIGFTPHFSLQNTQQKKPSALSDPHLQNLQELCEQAGAVVQDQLDRSNFAVEMHQALLELVITGTSALQITPEAADGQSALSFRALPLSRFSALPGPSGRLTRIFCQRYPDIEGSPSATQRGKEEIKQGINYDTRSRLSAHPFPQAAYKNRGDRPQMIDVFWPGKRQETHYLRLQSPAGAGCHVTHIENMEIIARGVFQSAPVIVFRWTKRPDDIYGRSPVMRALPDIKTANKIMELILKNASLAVTGIWQAADDGVLNPEMLTLEPGMVIPKAAGSEGLVPLKSAADFPLSQELLSQMRQRIRSTMLADIFDENFTNPNATATEIIARQHHTARILGALFGRLQSELLTPMINRILDLLVRRGLLPEILLHRDVIRIQFLSPLARAQAMQDVQTALLWLEGAQRLGPDAMSQIDSAATIRWLAQKMGAAEGLLRPHPPQNFSAPLPPHFPQNIQE